MKLKDINDQSLAYYKNLSGTLKIHKEDLVFLAESENVCKQLFKSDIEIISVLGSKKLINKYSEEIKKKRLNDENIYIVDKKTIDKIIGFKAHSAIYAIGKIPKENDIDELDDRIIILNGIINSENVGSIIRNARAFKINSIIRDKSSSEFYLRRCVRVSMGSVFGMKSFCSSNLLTDLNYLKNQGYKIISIENNDISENINEFKFPEKHVLIFGNEGNGIDQEILDISDHIIHIKINSDIPSINVAASSAIVFNNINLQLSL